MTPRHFWTAVLASLAIAVLLGSGGLFFVFLVAYGFADAIEPLRHVVFLVGTAVVAGLSTLVATVGLRPAAADARSMRSVARLTTTTAYLAALAGGVLVSLAHEDENSVTADQPDLPFIVLVVLCVVGVLACVAGLTRRYRRDVVSRG
ncbi:hypothetical protein [Aeromicrobium sp. 50.2.37]|uniref:hypothetical protein n=1 Tax=Aeromicrobium sp. 50.2.37 TaxID=2969305 RepID=UPI00214F7FAC|nr:hypothetical protein [Aeromicrobium sp. 50.2.37]MCR4512921.1 hypothetical protein [Aeromicrobium sp. 50.2.37]